MGLGVQGSWTSMVKWWRGGKVNGKSILKDRVG